MSIKFKKIEQLCKLSNPFFHWHLLFHSKCYMPVRQLLIKTR